jgi:sulfotransferase family protein
VSEPTISPRVENRCPTRPVGQPAGPRIFVFGCARSGTTLLLNLMRTLDGVSVMNRESCVRELVANPSAGWVAAKRKAYCADHLLADFADLRQVWIIDILRDPRDVITSRQAGPDPRRSRPTFDGFYCDYQRWARDVRVAAALRGRHMRMLHVRYEHLVTACDQVQQDLCAVLGLEARVPFSNHLSVMPADLPESTRIMLGGVRPVSSDRVGRWRYDPKSIDRVTEQMRLHPDMESWLQAAAYAPTETQATRPLPAHTVMAPRS